MAGCRKHSLQAGGAGLIDREGWAFDGDPGPDGDLASCVRATARLPAMTENGQIHGRRRATSPVEAGKCDSGPEVSGRQRCQGSAEFADWRTDRSRKVKGAVNLSWQDQNPLKTGGRFSTYAIRPSLASLLSNSCC